MKSAARIAELEADLAVAEGRLRRQVEKRQHWEERAISAEQALGLYGPKETKPKQRSYVSPYCDEATDSGHSSSAGLVSWP